MTSRKFRILIDATTITDQKDGLSQYIISLIAHLPEEAKEVFEFIVLRNKKMRRKDLLDAIVLKNLQTIETSIAHIGPKRDWDFFWFLQKHKKQFDLFHSTSNQYPFFLKNGIATFHDITFKKYFNTSWKSLKLAPVYLNIVVKNAIRKSAAVIAVSESTKNDLISSYMLNTTIQNKITVIHEGWEHCLEDHSRDIPVPLPALKQPYLFYVGSTRRHKNIFNLLKAFYLVTKQLQLPVNLVLCGNSNNIGDEEKKLISIINSHGERVIFKGFVSGAELKVLYHNSDAFIFPSIAEGFGIPILESFSYKKPLLCSNTSSFPEIAGNAAIYFDPFSVQDMARAIVFFYQNPGLRQELIEKGNKRLTHFSWKKTTLETVEVYQKALLVNNKKSR